MLPIVVSASKLTPKQLQRKLEAENRLKEKLRLKEERERKVAEELEKKKKDREEKEEQRRQEKEEKEKEKEDKKRKEREDREKKRLEEIEARKRKEEQREEERKRKEELKDEERRKKEEEKTAKEEADKQKNRKEAAAFTKFFVKQSAKSVVPTAVVDQTEVECRLNFMPFCVKEDMKLAPQVRRVFSDSHRSDFDTKVLSLQSKTKREDLYVSQLKSGLSKRGRSGKTWITDETDVQIVGMYSYSFFFNITFKKYNRFLYFR